MRLGTEHNTDLTCDSDGHLPPLNSLAPRARDISTVRMAAEGTDIPPLNICQQTSVSQFCAHISPCKL